MRAFMDENFLLSNDTAKTLYHDYAAKMPIIDYHCHINPAEIYENRRFENITQAWLGGDHYKWRLIRANGVNEQYITGDSSDWEKFQKFAEVMPKCIGNPVYHWTHLELKFYFGCDLPINPENAQAIWDLTSEKLKSDDLSVRGIIAKSGVQAIATTDDPVDDLHWHKLLQEDPTNTVDVVPCFRPDKATNIHKPGFTEYIAGLAQVSGIAINTVDDLFSALEGRINFFDSMGCRASDHGIDYIVYREGTPQQVNDIFQKAMSGGAVTGEESEIFQTTLMLFFGREFAKRNWVMQIHYGAIRNTNAKMFQVLGPDTGYDCIGTKDCSLATVAFLDALNREDNLPQMVLYSLNPNDNALLGTIIGCFQNGDAVGKLQHGSAWWFNDSKLGMEAQITNLANLSVLGNFIGMLTDSRSFLSYTRHEYFRRILCNVLGALVENGEYPADIPALGQMVEDISYRNTARYFRFDVKQ